MPNKSSSATRADTSTLPTLWVSRANDLISGNALSQFFRLIPLGIKPAEIAKVGEHHIIAANADEPELNIVTLASALIALGCRVDVFDPGETLSSFVFPLGHHACPIIVSQAKPYQKWHQALELVKLKLEEALELARFYKSSGESQLQISLKLNTLRERVEIPFYDWNRFLRLLEEEMCSADDGSSDPDERLRLELKALLRETDPIKRMRKRARIASHYNFKLADIEQALRGLEERSQDKEPNLMGLNDLFSLPQMAIEYVIPGMLPVGETALLVASPKAGKSLLAYDAAFAVATGEDCFLGEEVKQGRVLIIQCDESINTARGRLLKRGFRAEDDPNVRFVDSFKFSQMHLLEEWLDSFRPTLVIIDSLRRISAGRALSENSAEFADAVYQLKELIARYNAAGILIHHANKNQEAVGTERVRGSSAITGAVWGVWQLDHILKPDPNNKKRQIIDPKDPTRVLSIIARDVEGQRLQIELNPENNQWINLGEEKTEDSEATDCKTYQDEVLKLLRSVAPTGLEAMEINEHLNLKRSIYSHLNRLLAKGVIGSRPSSTDRRRTVYYYPQETTSSLLPPPSPTPTDHFVIECPESLAQYGVENRSQIDHNSITQNEPTSPQKPSNPEPTSVVEVDHKIDHTREGGGQQSDVIDSTDDLQKGDRLRYQGGNADYRRKFGRLTMTFEALELRAQTPEFDMVICKLPNGQTHTFLRHTLKKV